MRGIGTWLVVAAVLGLGLVATVDALQDEDPVEARTTKTQEEGPAVPEERELAARLLREQSIRGTIAYLDDGCELRSATLPGLEERQTSALQPVVVVSPSDASSCRFSMSRGTAFAVGPAVPDARGTLIAGCRNGRVGVGTRTGTAVAETRGCGPAWKPSGNLTVIRDGELIDLGVVRERGGLARRPRVLLSREDLARAFNRDPWALPQPVIREAAWLADDLVAVIVRDRKVSDHAIALFRGSRLVAGPPFPYPRLSGLRVSPFGSYVAARVGSGPGTIILDDAGSLVSVGIRTARAIAWSPDEAWTALATTDGVFVFPTGERAISLIRLPITARDLVWR